MDEQLLRELATNKNTIKQLTERNEEIIRDLGLRTGPIGTEVVGDFLVEVSKNARFSAAIAEELFPFGENGENSELYRVQIDPAKAKKKLTPEQYEACQQVFPNNKVEVKFI